MRQILTEIKNKKLLNILLSLGLYVGIISCSFNYREAEVADFLNEDVPDIQFLDLTLHYVRGTEIIVSSENAEVFSSKDRYDIYGVEFQETDKQGNTRMLGRADQATIAIDTNDVVLIGDIWVRSNNDEAEIRTEYVQWKDEDRMIEGREDAELVITRDDGSSILGYGFRGNADSRELTLKSGVKGSLVVEEDAEENE